MNCLWFKMCFCARWTQTFFFCCLLLTRQKSANQILVITSNVEHYYLAETSSFGSEGNVHVHKGGCGCGRLDLWSTNVSSGVQKLSSTTVIHWLSLCRVSTHPNIESQLGEKFSLVGFFEHLIGAGGLNNCWSSMQKKFRSFGFSSWHDLYNLLKANIFSLFAFSTTICHIWQ